MEAKETVNRREQWVDIAKGIAMVAIVLGHIHYNYPNCEYFPISTLFFWLWHVPVFFLIGGFFLRESKLLKPVSFIFDKYKKIGFKVVIISLPFILGHNWLLSIGFYDSTLSIGGYYVSSYTPTIFIRKFIGTLIMHDTEIIVDPLWFAQVLFWALALLSVLCFLLRKTKLSDKVCDRVLCVILLSLALLGNILSKQPDVKICPPQVGSIFTATWLIYMGYKIINTPLISGFNNTFYFVLSLIVVYSFAVLVGPVNLKVNRYSDIILLTISSTAALYVISFISKRIKGLLSKVLAAIGKDSFYIMGLHIIAFKPCTLLLNVLGYDLNVAQTHAISPDIMSYLIYSIGGIVLPLVLIYTIRLTGTTVKNRFKRNIQGIV